MSIIYKLSFANVKLSILLSSYGKSYRNSLKMCLHSIFHLATLSCLRFVWRLTANINNINLHEYSTIN